MEREGTRATIVIANLHNFKFCINKTWLDPGFEPVQALPFPQSGCSKTVATVHSTPGSLVCSRSTLEVGFFSPVEALPSARSRLRHRRRPASIITISQTEAVHTGLRGQPYTYIPLGARCIPDDAWLAELASERRIAKVIARLGATCSRTPAF